MKLKTACLIVILISFIVLFAAVPNTYSQNEEQVKPPETTAAAPEKQPVEKGQQEVQQPGILPPQPNAGQAPSAQPEKVPAEKSTTGITPVMPAEAPQQQKSPATVSFFFDDADIFEVVQTVFADILKVNYIIDPQVKGRVNFRTVTPIPKDEVLSVINIIFRLNGIGYVEEGGLYRIIPLTEVPKELVYSQVGKPPDKVAVEMFTFKNLDLKEAMPDIQNALGLYLKGGTVRIIPVDRLNALIVVASSRENLEYIRKWVDVFDAMFLVARPKIYVYSLQNSKADHIASLLQSIFSGSAAPSSPTTPSSVSQPSKSPTQTGAASAPAPTSSAPRTGAAATATSSGTFVSRDTRVFADDITNSLIILAIPADYKFIEETIKKIDKQQRQVVIEGLIAQVTLTDNLSFGFSWSLNTKANISGIKPFTNGINLAGTASNNAGDFANVPTTGFTFVGTDPTGNVRALLNAALIDSKGKVLAAPHILVSDNREARIQVGSQIPLATSTTSYITTTTSTTPTTTTNPITSSVEYKDIGIILKVKPQINDSGVVTLELTQEVSSVGSPVTIAGQDFSSIDKTEATTNLVAKDGETIIIGGLIREDVTKSKTGIPFLSKIPLLGSLFSDTTDKSTRTELIILLTPRVVRNQKEAADVTTDYLDRYRSTTKDKDINDFIKEKNRQKNDTKDVH